MTRFKLNKCINNIISFGGRAIPGASGRECPPDVMDSFTPLPMAVGNFVVEITL